MLSPSSSRVYVFRLLPHQDLKQSILEFAVANQIQAGIILTCAGSLEQYNLRFANEKTGVKSKGYFEIVSLGGTFSATTCHIHICISDNKGQTIGGHLLDDNLVYTTAEIAVAALPDYSFERHPDPTYGYQELIIKETLKK